MRVLLVDDEPLALRRLEILLSRRPWIQILGSARDGASAIEAIERNRPDLILLDVQMPGLDGIEVADYLRTQCDPQDAPDIIFITAFDNFAVEAFQAAAIDYLLKPVEVDRLDQALSRAKANRAAKDAQSRADELESVVRALRSSGGDGAPDLWVKDRNGSVRIEKWRIDWIEAEGDYVRIHAGERSWLMRNTMAAMEDTLDQRLFTRVHRSAIVNVRAVERLGSTQTGARMIKLSCGAEIRVGRAYERAVQDAMSRIAT